MRRRQFLMLLGSAATPLPVIASAQQQGRLRIVGILNITVGQGDFEAFKKKLLEYGWSDGATVRLQHRIPGTSKERIQSDALELINLAPDVLVSSTTVLTAALAERTQQIPIVFIGPYDPIQSGFSGDLARPSRNMTGFTNPPIEGSKFIQLLREMKPDIRRVTTIYDPDQGGGRYISSMFAAKMKQAAQDVGLEFKEARCSNVVEIEAALASLGQGDGLFVGADPTMFDSRRLIIDLAARYRIPAIYPWARYAREGGLMAYSVDYTELWRRAAGYVDRLLRGMKLEELPIEQPATFDLDLNLATAKALGLTVPSVLLVQATHLIE